jgi:diaminohydroxyphosphoribosylaminopyrimidine deaminase / 5-amino-6-(5-phosphoribosylamino)uracil reductase
MTGPDNSKSGFSEADHKYMKLAIRLAEKAAGNTSPNPVVGAVIVREGNIISTGFHKKAGNPHAEIEAINACTDPGLLEGATLYVTLEPCSVFGRTPPCTDALISHKFGEVVVGSIDPNPKINGGGIELLQKAGIRTRFGLFEDIIAKQNEIFFKSVAGRTPFVALKIASSIDGKTALKNKKSKWITSAPARGAVQKIRYRYDCILTGINTVIEDDPMLYPRYAQFNRKAPLFDKKFFRVILDSGLRIGRDSNIIKTASAIKTIIFIGAGRIIDTEKAGYLKKAGIDILKAGGLDFFSAIDDATGNIGEKLTYLDLKEVMEILYSRYGITSVLVESGPALITEFIKHSLADKFYFFIAPKIIGGDSPFNMFSGLGLTEMDDAFKLDFDKISRVGGDIFITAYPSNTGSAIV